MKVAAELSDKLYSKEINMDIIIMIVFLSLLIAYIMDNIEDGDL